MKSIKFKRSIVERLTPPCMVVVETTYSGYGKAYILWGYDEKKEKYRLVSVNDPHYERFVKGNFTVVCGYEFEEL